ncbi:MAG: hypothetical protein AB2809_13680 [Candidatus Thiodiazotropha sp.]
MELVRNFVQTYRALLVNCISEFRNGREPEKVFGKLKQIENEWNAIPLIEKQIPYQDGEKEFWFAYHTLHILLNPKPITNPRGEILGREHPAWDEFREHLGVAEGALRNNVKLPEDINARRLLS